MSKSSFISFTNIARVIVVIAVLTTLFSEQRWTNNTDVIKSDIRGYYTYLPALFIYDDICINDPGKYPEDIWFVNEADKNRYIKYSCGPALFYAPFFLVAHQLAEPLGYEANGYTTPYRFSLVMSSFAFLLLALIYLGKFLLRHFSDQATGLALLLVFLGTNIWTYSVNEMAFPHIYSLALVSMFFYFGAKWLESPTIQRTIINGLIAGLMVLTRPVDAIFLLFFLLYGISSGAAFRERLQFIWKHIGRVVLMVICFVVALSPQFIYYKVVLGQFFYFTYREEGFFFASPHLFDTLLSFRNGYLVYSPLMFLALLGFFFLRRVAQLKYFAITVFLLYFYVIASWWCWWYVGFGNRAFINVVPVLALPLTAVIDWLISKRWSYKYVLFLTVLGGIVLNFFQAGQHAKGIIHWDGMTKEAYMYSFNEQVNHSAIPFKIEYPSYDSAMVGKDFVRRKELDVDRVIENDFNTSSSIPKHYLENPQGLVFTVKEGSIAIPSGVEFLFDQEIDVEQGDHLRFSAWINGKGVHSLVATSIENPNYYYATSAAEKSDGKWRYYELIVDLNAFHSADFPSQLFKVYIWNQSLQPLSVDNYKVEIGNIRFSEPQPD